MISAIDRSVTDKSFTEIRLQEIESMLREALTWCSDNVEQGYWFTRYGIIRGSVTFCIYRKEDALAFKLKFGEYAYKVE